MEKNQKGKYYIGPIILVIGALLVTGLFWVLKWEPSGYDVWGHLFKSRIMYENLQEGNWYPLYTETWYNGIQPFRYGLPFTYYVLSFFQMLTGGDIVWAYYLFAGSVFFFGGLPFLLLGKDLKRPYIGIFCAVFWFVIPDNIRVFFCEGNLPRVITTVMIPYVVYFVWRYVRLGKKSSLFFLIPLMSMMTIAHLMFTAIVGIGTFLFLLFDWMRNRNTFRVVTVLGAMVIGILAIGICFIPAMSGGMLAMGDSSSSVRELFMFHLATSLNPMNRVDGVADTFYYGISVVVVAVFGILLAHNDRKAGYVLSMVVLLGATPAAVSFIKHLPLGDFLWMARFAAMSYGFFLLSFMEWKTLKKKYLGVLVALLVLDSGVTLRYLERYYIPASDGAKESSELLREYTTQRASLMDLSTFGSYPSWDLPVGETGVDYVFGWVWQGSVTSTNIMLMNDALEQEQYLYVFDRSIEMGSDTVAIRKIYVYEVEEMFAAAVLCGYELVEETGEIYLFHKETPKQFGVQCQYDGLAIGSYANTLEIYYPRFTTGNSIYVDEYTEEELLAYQVVYLSGFQYHNQSKAEELLCAVAEKGTRVVIDASHIPENGLKRLQFLDVTENQLAIETDYPNLFRGDGVYVSGILPDGDTQWNVGYVSQADHVLVETVIGNQRIPVVSYNDENENIYFVGMNLPYYAMRSRNEELWELMQDCFPFGYQELPQRELVPMTVTIETNHIVIESEKANVNTTLAFQDNFVSEQLIYEKNNLLMIGDTHVEIDIVYPLWLEGMLVSVFGLICAGVLLVWVMRKKEI